MKNEKVDSKHWPICETGNLSQLSKLFGFLCTDNSFVARACRMQSKNIITYV